jgi:hypothetical protein
MAKTETTIVPITPMSPAKLVREELCRITGQQLWSDNNCWNFYLANPRPSPISVHHRAVF